jgi:aerobic carbon-monoxide dehydrogenase large subunit
VIGQRRLRKEDPRFLTGRGRYLADHHVEGLHHVALVRSPAAHAVIRGIDTSEASALPGVLGVYTQVDLDAAGAQRMGHLLDMPGMQSLEWTVLVSDRVRFAGEPVVAVVATSRALAEDALELVELDLESLPSVVDPERALASDAPLLYPEWGTNELLHLEAASPGLADAIAGAPHVLRERFESHRIMGLPLEGHGAQAEYDAASDRLTMVVSTQQPHQLRTVIAEVCGMTEASVRVVAPDMGGGFGNKQHFLREECLVAMLARITGVPVRWEEDRAEALTASVHSRPQVHDVTAAYDDDGRLLALSVDVTSDVGNPVLYFSGIGPSLVTVGALCGAYAVPEHGWTLSCVATTTCPVGAYRGFGQPQAHLTIERVMDRIAQHLDLDPVEVRRRNLLPDDAPRPITAHGGARVDIGLLGPQLDQLLAEFGYDDWRTRRREARDEGRYVGIGVSVLVQGGAPTQYGVAGRFGSWEVATVSVLPDGSVTVAVGTKSQGQGHETSLAQVAADVLRTDDTYVTVSEGDTATLPYGMGSWGSRTAVMAGGAVTRACTELRTKMDAIAAHVVRCGGTMPDFRAIAEEAWWHPHRLPEGMDPGLTTTVVHSPGNTVPVPDERGHMNFDETFGSHATAVAVEVDAVTGHVRVLDAVMVVDSGLVINPAIVEGQHQGGFAQGLGNVLHEELVYSEEGQPLCSTLVDYTIPSAGESVALRIVHRATPSEVLGGFRGAGEAAITAAPAVLVGAVEDALAPLGVRLSSTRLSASSIWRAVQDARSLAGVST